MFRRTQIVAVVCAATVLTAGLAAGVVAPGATTASTNSTEDIADSGDSSLLQNASADGDNGTETSEHGDGAETDPSEGGDSAETSADGAAESGDATAYQFDVALGDVITDLGSSEDAFYARQGRLLQAQTARADGTVTSSFRTGASTRTVEDCQVTYDAVSYDPETGNVTVSASLEGCESATLTLAAYELPGDTVEFRRDRADEQELVAHQTTTVDGGESVTLTLDVNAGESSTGDGTTTAAPSDAESTETETGTETETPDDSSGDPTATETPTETPEETPTETPEETSTETPEETSTETPTATPTPTETPEAADESADLRISDINKEVEENERENLERETVTVTNDGDAAADLSGYTLLYGTDDQREQTYTFDEGFTLGAGESVTVHTGEGTDTETDVYLGSGNAVLNNEESETLVLRDADGDTVDEEST